MGNRKHELPAILLIVLVYLVPTALTMAQDDAPLGDVARKNRRGAADSRRVLTNEDVAPGDPALGVAIPDIPNLVRCAQNTQCFLDNVEKGVPAFVTRKETNLPVNDAIVTSTVSWWTTGYSGDSARLSFRVEDFRASVREEVFKNRTESNRKESEAKIAEAIASFERYRKEINVCTVARKDLKTVLTSTASSLMTIGPATGFGKTCSGKMFEPDKSAAP